MLIRQEIPSDVDAIDAIHRAAFREQAPEGAEPVEVGLVHALRADSGWVAALSLVAEDATGTVVGHVIGTEGRLGDAPAVGLGPVGVVPDRQGGGVGGALMHAALGAADALSYPVVVLLGHLDYYPRFGFVAASTLGIAPTDPAWGDHFQARTLSTWSPVLAGDFRYASPFDEL
jgi:putative acetyltransferase